MPISPRIGSIALLARDSKTASLFSLGLADFLDGFYEQPSGGKLADEPISLKSTLEDEGYADAYLAALAEHLALQFHLPVPAWTQNPNRILKIPRFAFESEEGRMFLLMESPTAFRKRHIFISADGLSRV
jgi:hypothetical protein